VVDVPFHLIRVNLGREGLEVVFPLGNNWYRCKWDKVPERFKHLYYAYLKLLGKPIPDWLKEYTVKTISIENTIISIDLDNCREVPEGYPLV